MKKILVIVFILIMSVSVSTTYAVTYETPAGKTLQNTNGDTSSAGTRVTGSVVYLDGNGKVIGYHIICGESAAPECFSIIDGGKKLNLPDGVLATPDETDTLHEGTAVDDSPGS